jgi:AraC family transcriptional regulator
MTRTVDFDRLEYEKRVNLVIDHVYAHLAEDLSLVGLARVAAFSPFHFHRIFRAISGETLFAFVQRLRLERAALALTHHRDRSILAVALDHGFSSAATFARAFKAHFDMSATDWRRGGAERWSKRGKANRNQGKARSRPARHGGPRKGKEASMNVRIGELPKYHVAYMRYVGPYGPHGIPALWKRLYDWMRTHGLDTADAVKLGIAHDDPDVTAVEKLRYDACVVVPSDFAGDKWVNVMDVPGGRMAISVFTGTAHEIEDAWSALYRTWLPGSGYEPDDRPCLEVYRGNPDVAGRPGAFRCELCIPVRPR